jgi:hypothetical protein
MSGDPTGEDLEKDLPALTRARIEAGALIDEILSGAVFGAIFAGFVGAAGGAVVGVLQLKGQGEALGESGKFIGGAVGTAVAAVLGIALSRYSFRPWGATLAWFLAGLAVASFVAWQVGEHVKGRSFPWAAGGAVIGLIGGAFSGPIRAVQRQVAAHQDAGALTRGRILLMLLVLGSPIKLLSKRAVGSALAGVVGGALAGAVFLGCVGQFGGREGESLYGGWPGAAWVGAALGALSGMAGGLSAWRYETRRPLPADPDAGVKKTD